MMYLKLAEPTPLDIDGLKIRAQQKGREFRTSRLRAKRILRIIKRYGSICEKCCQSKITIHHETYIGSRNKYSLNNKYKIWCPLCHGSYHFEEIIIHQLVREIKELNKSDKVYFKYRGGIDGLVYKEVKKQYSQFQIK